MCPGASIPLRPWSKIPLLLALPLPYFLLHIPLSCPFLPPLFRGRNPLTPSPPLLFSSPTPAPRNDAMNYFDSAIVLYFVCI